MRILLDTHLLIWTKTEPRRLSREARAYIEDLTNNLYFSAASVWEISIKRALGRSDFDIHPSRLYNILLDAALADYPGPIRLV